MRERDAKNPALSRFDKVAALLTGDLHATAEGGVEWVQKLVADLSVASLGTYGVREEHIPNIVAKAAKASSMKANPVVLAPDELAHTLRQAL